MRRFVDASEMSSSDWHWPYERISPDRVHDILITLGAANATVLAFALGIGLFVFQTATRYAIPGLRLRYPVLRYLYVVGFALLTVVGPIAVSPWPSPRWVTSALVVTVAFYATLPLFVSWVGRDALPDTVIKTSLRSIKRRPRAKKYPRRLDRARQSITAVHAATLTGDIRDSAEAALWAISAYSLRSLGLPRVDGSLPSHREGALEGTVYDIVDYLSRQAIESGAIPNFRRELAGIAPRLVLRQRCRNLVLNRFSAAARTSAAIMPENAAEMVRVMTDIASTTLAEHQLIYDIEDVAARSHAATMSSWLSDSGPTLNEARFPGDVAVSTYPSVANRHLPMIAASAVDLFRDVPASPRGDELVDAIVDLLVVPTAGIEPITVLSTRAILAAAREMFDHLWSAESETQLPPARRRARHDAVVSVTTGLLKSAQQRGVLHVDGRTALAELMQMATDDLKHGDVEAAKRSIDALRDVAGHHFRQDQRRTLSGDAATEALLTAAARDLAALTARYALADSWANAYVFATNATVMLHPNDVHRFAARYIPALDDAWHRQQLQLMEDEAVPLWDQLSDLRPPSVTPWAAQTFRPDVILTALVAAWALAITTDDTRITETKVQRRAEEEERLEQLLAASAAADEVAARRERQSGKRPYEEATSLILRRLLSRGRLQAICDAIDGYQDQQPAWVRAKLWVTRARLWLEATRGRDDAPVMAELLAPMAVTDSFDGLRRLLREPPDDMPEPGFRPSSASDWDRAFGWRSSSEAMVIRPDTRTRSARTGGVRRTYLVAVTDMQAHVVFEDRDRSLFLLPETDDDGYEGQPFALRQMQATVAWNADGAARLIRDHALGDYGLCRTCLGATRGHRSDLACPECHGTGCLPGNILRAMREAVWQGLRNTSDDDGLRRVPLAEARSWLASALEVARPSNTPSTQDARLDSPSPESTQAE